MAVRPNGRILPATATSAVLYELDASTGSKRLIHDWRHWGDAIMGITDVAPDLFVANTMTCNMTELSCTPGTAITWLIDFRETEDEKPVRVSQLTQSPDPKSLLNGMAALDDRTALMADQALGGIWAIDIVNGSIKLLLSDDSMKDPSNSGGGVNGIRVRCGMLYFSNPSIGAFARIPIDPVTGTKTGNASIIASGLKLDDFEIDLARGVAYVANGSSNQLLKVCLV